MEKEWVSGTPKWWVRSPAFTICPGCHNGTIQRIICEVIEELGIGGRAIIIGGVGCSSFATPMMFAVDGANTAHGRAPDVATGIKRVSPDNIVFTIMGDGDCISIGAGSFINAAGRAEKITNIMVNNSNYGATGGQLAPTTIMEQITTTTPQGRDATSGYPTHVPELISSLKGVAYAARGAVNNPTNYQRIRGYVKTAFQKQIDNVGFSFVEILSACPTDWHLTPVECLRWIEEKMIAEFPLGEFKNVDRIE